MNFSFQQVGAEERPFQKFHDLYATAYSVADDVAHRIESDKDAQDEEDANFDAKFGKVPESLESKVNSLERSPQTEPSPVSDSEERAYKYQQPSVPDNSSWGTLDGEDFGVHRQAAEGSAYDAAQKAKSEADDKYAENKRWAQKVTRHANRPAILKAVGWDELSDDDFGG